MRMQWHLAKGKLCREKNKENQRIFGSNNENSEDLFKYVRHVNTNMTNTRCTVSCPADIIKKTRKNQIWQNENSGYFPEESLDTGSKGNEKQLHITE